MKIIPLSTLGLETVAEVGRRKGAGWSAKSVQLRIRAGLLPVVVVGEGRSAKFLLRTADVDAFAPPGQGKGGGSPTHKSPRKAAPRKRKTATT